jgi:hypothetical protein
VQSGVLPLRPLTLGELLDAAVGLLRGHAKVLLAVGLLLAAAEQAVLYPLRLAASTEPPLFIPYEDALGPYWLMIAIGVGTEIMIIALLGGLTARAAGPALFGERVGAGRLLAPAGSRFGAVLLVAVAAGVAGALAALACLLPWFVVYPAVGLIVPALVIDRVGVFRAVGRSIVLTVRGGMRAAGVRIAGYIGWWAVRLALGMGSIALLDLAVGGDPQTLFRAAAVAWAAVNALAYPALACLDAVLHLETRMRTEGLDIALSRARVIGSLSPAALAVRP